MNLIKHFTLTMSLLFISLLASSQKSYPLWKGLEPGVYKVGFRTIDYRDQSRSIPEEGGVSQFFPIQLSIWYPTAEQWTTEKALPFEHYFFKTAQKNDFEELSDEQKAQAMDIFFGYAKYGLSIEFTQEEQDEIGNQLTSSIANAMPADGLFPVLLAGHDGGVWKMSTLCEYLASHGYVIISTGPLSGSNQLFRQNTQQAINRRIRTFEIVRGMLDQFPQVDQTRIGLLGLNSDGISTLLYQMKNQTAKAIVSIDGWEGKNNGYRYTSNSIYYDLKNVSVPRMEFHQHESPENEDLHLNTTIFDSLTHIDRFSFVMKDFGHAYLTGNLFALPHLDETVDLQHYFWYESIQTFFNAYLKGEDVAKKNLWKNRTYKSDDFFVREKRIKSDNQPKH